MISTKKNGMRIRSMKVAESRPPVTAVPMAFWAAAPASVTEFLECRRPTSHL
jgi:hypothetical protein